MKKDVHKINFANLKTLSDEVFDLEKQYKFILQSIAVRKNTPNLDDIEKFVARSDTSNVSRSAVRRRLNGSSTLMGLIPSEYVSDITNEKPHYRNEKDYYLTLKGMFAILSSVMPMERIYSFYSYFDFLSKMISNNTILDLVKHYVKSELRYFLSWHAVMGLQLTKLTYSFVYIYNFLNSNWEYKIAELPWSKLGKEGSNNFQSMFVEYITLQKTLEKIKKQNLFPTIIIEPQNIWFDNIKIEDKSKNEMSVFYLIKYWYCFIEKLQLDYWEKSSLDDVAIQNPVYLSDIEVSDLITKITNRSNLYASRLLKKNKI